MNVEDKFFPLIAGELGDSREKAEHFQKKLDEFTPTVKVVRLRADAVLFVLFYPVLVTCYGSPSITHLNIQDKFRFHFKPLKDCFVPVAESRRAGRNM